MERIEFTKAMKETHTILIPTMLPIHFELLKNILNQTGYHVELLKKIDDQISETGLKYVHNDTCTPAMLVIGQMIDALQSGKYDVDHIALAITQTGGGCRASNYIHLLRKALVQAGFPQVPVISFNFSKLEKNSGFKMQPMLMLKLLYAFLYGDLLMWLKNQCLPYEKEKGTTQKLVDYWIDQLTTSFLNNHFLKLKTNSIAIVESFNAIKRQEIKKIKVGIVGEIYMKYSPLGNRELENFLLEENCEPVVSGVIDFGLYCLQNSKIDYQYYHRSRWMSFPTQLLSHFIQHLQAQMNQAILQHSDFHPMEEFKQLLNKGSDLIDFGVKMGEGWLLTHEIASLLENDVHHIISCQPFGCLPNHIVAKGVSKKIKEAYPFANLVCIDYDPSASIVNQENRIRLMLENARSMEFNFNLDYQEIQQTVPLYNQ